MIFLFYFFFVILAPDKPSNLRVKAQFAYYFILEWEAPTKVHGIITGYQVSGTHNIRIYFQTVRRSSDRMRERKLLTANPKSCNFVGVNKACLLYTSPSPRDKRQSRMPSSA